MRNPIARFVDWLATAVAPRLGFFFAHPLRAIGRGVILVLRGIRYALISVGRLVLGFYRALPRTRWVGALVFFVRLLVVLAAGYYVFFSYVENQIEPRPHTGMTVRYLNQGWGGAADSPDRMTYYYTPQGANVRALRYSWFIHLERPWKKERFADPKYMQAYGFIVDPAGTPENPDQLPIGMTSRWDQTMGEAALDLTCAACHTGQLETEGAGAHYAVRIDGGPALHEITGIHMAHFSGDLIASLLSTELNPFKWRRFCANVLGSGNSFGSCSKLAKSYAEVVFAMLRQGAGDASGHLYPVDEGYGRTDALGRIANNTFATNLHNGNYHVADAPVSYPPVWDIWKLDWVQYTGSVKQPMARNIGESLGTGAKYFLLDEYRRTVTGDQRYETSAVIVNLNRIEETLRKLRPPQWPEDVFGAIDHEKAEAGRKLFYMNCYRCHGPFYSTCARMRIDAPLKDNTTDHWMTKQIPLDVIGTDKTSAMNFVNNRYDLSATGITAEELRAVLRPTYAINYQRLQKWCNNEPWCRDDAAKPLDQYLHEQLGSVTPQSVSVGEGLTYVIGFIRQRAYAEMNPQPKRDLPQEFYLDGYAQLDMPRVQKAYRPRPLIGIWATPPYLHNGSVPNLYEMLIPVARRSKRFYIKSRTFDPFRVGLRGDPGEKNVFLYDTSIPGNLHIGHEFRTGYRGPWKEGDVPSYGIIGPELTDEQRFQIIEYLKVMKQEDFPPPLELLPPGSDTPVQPQACPKVPQSEINEMRSKALGIPVDQLANDRDTVGASAPVPNNPGVH